MLKSRFSNVFELIGGSLLCASVGLVDHYFLAEDAIVDLWRPSTGLALALLLLGGLRWGWAVLAGAALETALSHGLSSQSVALTLGGVAGPLCGAWLLQRQPHFEPRLKQLSDYLQLMTWGGVLGSLTAALVGTGSLLLLGNTTLDGASELALRWWMGDLLGAALIAPTVLAWWGTQRIWHNRTQMLECFLLMGLAFLAGQMVFLDWFTDAQHRAPLGYWMFLFIGWAAIRLERKSVMIVLLMFTTQALVGAHTGHGFLAEDLQNTHLLGFWRYAMALTLAGTALACYTTHRRREAMELKANTLALRDRALDKVQEGVTVGNTQRQLTFVNDAFAKLTGYSREELLGKSCGRLLQGSNTDPETTQRIRDTLNAGQPFSGEILNYRKDGTSFWNDLSISPIFDDNGVLLEYFAVQRDITDRKASEAQLAHTLTQARDGARILETLMEHVPEGITIADAPDVKIRMVSRYALDLTGKTPDLREGIAVNQHAQLWEIYEADGITTADNHTLPLTRATQTGELVKDEEWVLGNAAGQRIPILCSAAPIKDEAGHITGGVVVWRDITQQKALHLKLQLAAQVLAQSHEGITVTDALGNIIMANEAFIKITGYTLTEVLGKNPRILTAGRHNKEFYRAMWEAILTQGHWSGEIWNRRKDGTIYPEHLTITGLRDTTGKITHYIGSFNDMSDAKAAENKIQWLSHFDPLTGLPNRTLLKDRTAHAISMVQRAGEPLTIMLLSIDHFKSINDALGHEVGDQLLSEMTKRLCASVRDQDTVARLGGKEFVLVLPGTPSTGAAHLASELLWKLAEPYDLGGHETTLTASIGIASYPENGTDFDSLFKAVEIAVHKAQSNGRDNFQFYNNEMYQQVLARDHMTKALRHAASLDQLQLIYQPLVDLQTGHISGMEALLRWYHPELGSVSPAEFIPLAEEAGLIRGIGEWVLRRACLDIRHWLDKGIKVPHVAVNVSPLQFHDPNLVTQIKRALDGSQIDPALLYIELTEGALMDDVPRSEAMLKELKSMGLKLSLDDFGTGYSSLSYLKRFPFDKVKIDQSFVRDITTNPSDSVIVKVIISMAHGLGLKVIAEGVETEAQCEFMRTSVCDEIQGYFFSKPISAQAMEDLLSEDHQLPAHLLRMKKPQRTLLLVDDEPNIVSALKRLFRRDGHIILTANSGPEGLDVLSRNKVDVIISDQRMPGMTGVEFLRAAKVNYPDTIRIVLSGYTELQSVTDAINEGAVYRFLTKPWEDDQLREHIKKAFEYKELLDENQQLDIKIRTTNQELVAANRQLGNVLQTTRHQIERDETSLAVVREALQHIPLAVIGLDDEGLMAFANGAAEALFPRAGPLLGVELTYALPDLDAALSTCTEGLSGNMLIDGIPYSVKWNTMGESSRSRGRLVTLSKAGVGS